MATDPFLPDPRDVTAIVLAAGGGARLGGQPKAFLRHRGLTLLDHAVGLLAPFAATVVACLPADRLDEVVAGAVVVAGGSSRQRSVVAGLAAAATPWILLHDAARPFAAAGTVSAVLAAVAAGAAAAIPVVPPALRDSAVTVAGGRVTALVPREELHHSVTPQAYRREPLAAALAQALASGQDEATSFAPLLRDGLMVAAVPAPPGNLKITWPEDLDLLDADSPA